MFARVNGIDPARVQWAIIQPQVREAMLVKGEIEFAAAFVMTTIPSLGTLGVKRDEINTMLYRDYGLDLYSNAVFTTPAFAKQHPDAVRGFVKATLQSWQAAAADPDASVAALKRAEPLSDPAIERVRLDGALDFIATPGVRQRGMGDVICADGDGVLVIRQEHLSSTIETAELRARHEADAATALASGKSLFAAAPRSRGRTCSRTCRPAPRRGTSRRRPCPSRSPS